MDVYLLHGLFEWKKNVHTIMLENRKECYQWTRKWDEVLGDKT